MKKTQLSKSKSKLPFLVICSSKYRKGRIVKVKHVRKFNEHIAGAHKKRIKRTTWPQQNNEFSTRI